MMLYENVRPTQSMQIITKEAPPPAAEDVVGGYLTHGINVHGAPAYDHDMAHLLAVASAWAYADATSLSNMMARVGLVRNRCRLVSITNDALFVRATAYLIQSECGRFAILCFRG